MESCIRASAAQGVLAREGAAGAGAGALLVLSPWQGCALPAGESANCSA